MGDLLLIENELVSSFTALFSLDFIRASHQEWTRQNGDVSKVDQTPVDFRLFVYTRALGLIINELNFNTDAHVEDADDRPDRLKVMRSL